MADENVLPAPAAGLPQPIVPAAPPAQPAVSPVPPKDEKPLIKYPLILWGKTQGLLKEIETKIGKKVLVYYLHPISSISNDDPDYFFSHIREMRAESLALIIVSHGGNPMAALRIANVLRSFCKELTVVVPSRCASAATLLVLSADKILLGPAGYLTAIDSSLTHLLNPRPYEKGEVAPVSVDQINRIVDFIKKDLETHPGNKSISEILFEKIHPIVFGEVQRSSSLSKLVALNLLGLRNNPGSAEEQQKLVDALNDAYPAHGFPIVLREAQKLGLPAEATSEELNHLLWELLKLYSLTTRKVATDFTPSFCHIEHSTVVIESVGKRTYFSNSFNRRLMPPPMGWQTEGDKSCWLSAAPNPESPDKPKISAIDL